jgi:hypothetical protein
MSDEFSPSFLLIQKSGWFFSIFENNPKVHIIFPQTRMQSNLKDRTSLF